MRSFKKRFFFIFVCIFFIFALIIKVFFNGLVTNSLLDEFYQDDPKVVEFQEYTKYFDPFITALAVVERKDRKKISNKDYKNINTLLKNIFDENPIVKTVQSFESIVVPRVKDGEIFFETLFINDEIDKAVDTRFEKNLPMKRIFFSENDQVIRFSIVLHPVNKSHKDGFLREIFNKIDTVNISSRYTFHFIGPDILRYSVFQEILKIQTKLLPIIVSVISLIMFVLFRNIRLIGVSLFTLGFSFISSAAILYFFQAAISAFSSFSLMFVFIVGTSDIVHLFSRAIEICRGNNSIFLEAIFKARDELIKPCFLTTLTTVVGLFSLVFSPFKTLHQFGVNGCVGMVVCFIMTFYILPELLSFFKFNAKIALKVNFRKWNPKIFLKYGSLHIVLGAFFFLISLPSLFSLNFQDDFFNKFTDNHSFTKAMKITQENFSNLASIDLVGRTTAIEEFENSEAFKKIQELSSVYEILSFNKIYEKIQSGVTDKLYFESIKNTILHLKESRNFFSSLDSRIGRIQINLIDTDSKTLDASLADIGNILEEENILNLKISGYGLLRKYFTDTLRDNYFISFSMTFLLIFIIFLFTYKSLKIALLAMIPNIVPPLIVIYSMTLLGISADMNIALICSMTLAISVDDTIHFFHKFLDEKKRNTEVSRSVNNTLALVAKPLIGSSLIISITLLIFMLGDIRLFSQFSALLSLALLVALYYDLIVLPALIIKLKKFI